MDHSAVAGITEVASVSPMAFGAAFDSWALSRTYPSRDLSDDTEAVQRAMWMAFGAWCVQHGLDPIALTASEFDAFLRSREGSAPTSELTARYAWRLVSLVDRVVNHWAAQQGRAPNRAAAELLGSNSDLRHANSGSKDPLPEVLSDTQDRTLVAFLQSSVPQGEPPVSLSRDGLWQDIRNRTGVALQRGAGLTPLEIRMLTVNSVFVDSDPAQGPWKVRAPATGGAQAHDTPVASWARPLLTRWMQLRTELAIPGGWLLPSTKSGKQWGKTAHFDSVADVLDAAGLVGFKGGSYRLRHTFAMRQLSRVQNSEAQVATWLGIDVAEMKRYRGVMMVPVDVG